MVLSEPNMNGVPLALGLVGGMALASTVRARLGSAQRFDRDVVRDLAARLAAWTREVIASVGDDPDTTEFDPNTYPVDTTDLERALGVPVLGFGYSRVAVRVAPGVVAKLPWREDGALRNESEYAAWSEATDEVQAMLLPPLDYVYPPGVIVFPEVEPVARNTRDAARLPAPVKEALRGAQDRWLKMSYAGVPGALTRDVVGTENWGWYDGRLVLLDYEDEGSFNRRPTPQKRRSREALRGAARAGRLDFPTWMREVARGAGYRSGAALDRAVPGFPFHDRWYDGVSVVAVASEIRANRGGRT